MALLLKGKVTTEFEIQSSATKFFHFLTKNLHMVQNICDGVLEAKVDQGDWHTIGSVRIWTITRGGKVETQKETIEAIDEQNNSVTFKLFDGDVGEKYTMLKKTLQVIDKEDTHGSIVTLTFYYEKINEDIPPPYIYMDSTTAINKEIDAQLSKA